MGGGREGDPLGRWWDLRVGDLQAPARLWGTFGESEGEGRRGVWEDHERVEWEWRGWGRGKWWWRWREWGWSWDPKRARTREREEGEDLRVEPNSGEQRQEEAQNS
jgi:hypothetical protein